MSIKLYERGAFSVKNGTLKGKGLDLCAEPPRIKAFLSTPDPPCYAVHKVGLMSGYMEEVVKYNVIIQYHCELKTIEQYKP